MAFPTPQPGLVLGYDFLFREQADAGQDNASKPHPCAIILVVAQGNQSRVSLLAISHMAPRPGEAAFRLKLTRSECREMGLDGGDHWINLRDINAFDWPEYDLVQWRRACLWADVERPFCAGRRAIAGKPKVLLCPLH